MSQLGINEEQMSQLESQLRQRSSELQQLRTGMSSTVENTWWVGPAGERFKNEWQSNYAASLAKLSDLLEQLSAEVRQRKEAFQAAGR